jgi:hypothetical protein
MGILDEAIREHLDLKRKHGARDSEISEIEDEALGSGERPDPFAAGELFGQVSEEPTALVEPPAAPPEPPPAEPPDPSFPEPPAAEPAPPEPSASPELPVDSESLEELMAEEAEPGPPEGADPTVPPPPPPETGPPARPEPSPPPAATEGQRGRALGRADLPTQEHLPPREETGDAPPVPSEPEPPEQGDSQLYDFETDSDLEEVGTDPPPAAPPTEESDDFEALGPVEEAEEADEDLYLDEEGPSGQQRGDAIGFEGTDAADGDEEGDRTEVRPADPDEKGEDEDLLSESPTFLDQDTDESLWFEKGPPKDFDFEDEE